MTYIIAYVKIEKNDKIIHYYVITFIACDIVGNVF